MFPRTACEDYCSLSKIQDPADAPPPPPRPYTFLIDKDNHQTLMFGKGLE